MTVDCTDVTVDIPLVTMLDGSVSSDILYSYVDIVPFGSSGSSHVRLAVMVYVPAIALNTAVVSLNSTMRLRTGPGAE